MTAAAAEPPALLLRPSAPVVGGVQLSLKDRAPQVQVSADGLSAASRKGYRSVRATHGAAAGAWYCEVLLESLGETGQARLGWVTSAANLNAPVGFDEHGYAFRCGGDRVHQGRREPYGCVCAEGDVVGLYLATGLASGSERVLCEGATYTVERELAQSPRGPSSVAFTVNGVSQGVAFTDLPERIFFPAASLFTEPRQEQSASVRFNFGPSFRYAPPSLDGLPAPRPFCELCPAPTSETAMDTT